LRGLGVARLPGGQVAEEPCDSVAELLSTIRSRRRRAIPGDRRRTWIDS